MWLRSILIGILVGVVLFAVSLKAQPEKADNSQIMQKLDKILQNQQEMFNYLKFIKNKV